MLFLRFHAKIGSILINAVSLLLCRWHIHRSMETVHLNNQCFRLTVARAVFSWLSCFRLPPRFLPFSVNFYHFWVELFSSSVSLTLPPPLSLSLNPPLFSSILFNSLSMFTAYFDKKKPVSKLFVKEFTTKRTNFMPLLRKWQNKAFLCHWLRPYCAPWAWALYASLLLQMCFREYFAAHMKIKKWTEQRW